MSAATARIRTAALGFAAAGTAAGLATRLFGGRPSQCDSGSFSKSEFRAFRVSSVRQVNHDTKILRCALPSEQHVMGMTVSSLVMVKGGAGGEEGKPPPARPYTPITTDDQRGYFELMVKGYPSGVVSKHLCSLKAGDMVEVKGPFEKLPYRANMKKRIGMVAGGSGITPMLQVLKEALRNPLDETHFTLIFGNQTPSDILLRQEIQELAATSQGRLRVVFIVDKNPSGDSGVQHVGYLTADVAKAELPPPSPDTLVYVCGPPGMMKAVSGAKGKPPAQGDLQGILKDLGYTQDMVFKF